MGIEVGVAQSAGVAAGTMNTWPRVLSFLVGTILIATSAVLGYC